MAMLAADAQPNLVAMGIVSAPEYLERRAACRGSWLRYPNVGAGKAITVSFVVRSLGVPSQIDQLLRLEQAAHSDILRVNVPWNETRLRGPVLSVAAWLEYAVQHLSSFKFVAKLDDDAYIYAPGVESLLREALRVAPSPDRIYLGAMSWFHWYPKIFERSGFGWSYTMSWSLGRNCRNATTSEERCLWKGCGACVGPFPFASGFLAVLSIPLAAELLSEGNGGVKEDDIRRLKAVTTLPTRTGGVQPKVMEDIWLGSLLYRRHPPLSKPVTYIALSEKDDKTLVADGWGLRATRSALLVHVKNHQAGKQLERFVAIDDFLHKRWCGEELAVTCRVGCRGFLTPLERKLVEEDEKWKSIWGQRVDNASFCNGLQQGASYCRVGARAPRKCPKRPVDLLEMYWGVGISDKPKRKAEFVKDTEVPAWKERLMLITPRVEELMNASRRMMASAGLQSEA